MQKQDFNNGWTVKGKEGVTKKVTLPHDAQITETRHKDASDSGHGYFPGGIYTYEKKFTPPKEWAGKKIILEFEGVYKNAVVSLNGKEIASHAYGYTGFFVRLKDIRIGEENIITVVADNSKLPNSRWYTGSGIYRPVWLYVGDEKAIEPENVRISTVSTSPATVKVSVYEADTIRKSGNLKLEIIREDGNLAEAVSFSGETEITIKEAQLWSEENPYLYTAKITDTATGDQVCERFGIRNISWSNKGLFVNGKEALLRGACIHHDNGILGAATYAESEYRRVRILKENGFNAIRSSHNPTSKALLDACDELGMYVMDETFDMWYNRKNPYDYGLDWEMNWRDDTVSMVKRDYNHPSVIMYSIGNEVAEPHEKKGLEAAKAQVELIHAMDSTRPVTCGTNMMIISRAAKGQGIYKDGEQNTGAESKNSQEDTGKTQNASLAFNIMASFIGSNMNKAGNSKKVDELTSPFFGTLDICGYNYGSGRYPLDGTEHPDRVVFGSETFPQDICKNWDMVKRYPYLIGDFMWTGWDYLGEAGIGAWSYTGGMPFARPYPWVLAGAGVIDILGNPDGSCKYAGVVWGLEKNPVIAVRPVNHPGVRPSKSSWRGTNALLSWSYRNCDGNKAEVEVFSEGDSAELFINGKSIGKKKLKDKKCMFKTKYQSGTITAKSYDHNGNILGSSSLSSSKGELILGIHPELENDKTGSAQRLIAETGKIVYIPISIEDIDGIVESNADTLLDVKVTGGTLLGFGSANPCTKEQYHTGSFTTYYGRSLAVVRMGDEPGECCITVSGNGFEPQKVLINVE